MEDEKTPSSSTTSRVSPLRGDMTHEEVVEQTVQVRNGLLALREDHYSILDRIRKEADDLRPASNSDTNSSTRQIISNDDSGCEVDEEPTASATSSTTESNNPKDPLIEDRIKNVTFSLEQLEFGIEESGVILGLAEYFQRMEANHVMLRLEMSRVQDENDWLRDELALVQSRLSDALVEVTELQEEKAARDFEDELRSAAEEAKVRPVTPSKIPVGSYRVAEETELNRALSGGGMNTSMSSSTSSCSGSRRTSSVGRSASPAPSKIPQLGGWRNKLSVYKSVMEREEEAKAKKQRQMQDKTKAAAPYGFKMSSSNGGGSNSRIPSLGVSGSLCPPSGRMATPQQRYQPQPPRKTSAMSSSVNSSSSPYQNHSNHVNANSTTNSNNGMRLSRSASKIPMR